MSSLTNVLRCAGLQTDEFSYERTLDAYDAKRMNASDERSSMCRTKNEFKAPLTTALGDGR